MPWDKVQVPRDEVQVPQDEVQVPRDKVQVPYSRRWVKGGSSKQTAQGPRGVRAPTRGAAKEGLVGLELGPVQGDVSRDRSFCFCFVLLKITRDVCWIEF